VLAGTALAACRNMIVFARKCLQLPALSTARRQRARRLAPPCAPIFILAATENIDLAEPGL